jgi:hypothetical protein
MTRNLKGLGFALVAVFALSGVVASMAAAKDARFTAESYPATFDGAQLVANVLEREGRKLTCEVATLSGTITATSATTVTATPTYSNCHSIILGVKFPATVTMNGCDFLFHLTGELNAGGQETFTAISDLVCTTPNEVEVHIYENAAKHAAGTSMCTIKFPWQNSKTTIDLTNKAANPPTTPFHYVEAHINIAGITSSVTPTNATCGLNAHNATSTLKGSATIKGTTDPNDGSPHVPQGLTVSTVS